MEFMNRIDKLIAEKGITRNILAKEVEGLNHNSFNAWIKRGTIPNGEIIANIADYFDVDIAYLLGRTDIKKLPAEVNPFSFRDTFQLEILGSIKAGYNGELVEEFSGERFPVPNEVMKGRRLEDLFALRVKGDSMYPTLLDGDIVILERMPSVPSGSMAAIIYDGDEVTIKKVSYVTGEDWFDMIPINPEYKTKRIEGSDLEECRVLGKVIYSFRKY